MTLLYCCCQNTFWWRWRESNPRPEVLRFEGITTILYLLLRRLVALALDAALVRAARALTNLPILLSVRMLFFPVHYPVDCPGNHYAYNGPDNIFHIVFKHRNQTRANYLVKYKYFCRINGSES